MSLYYFNSIRYKQINVHKKRQKMKDIKNTQKMKYTKPQILQMPCPSLFSCPFQFQAGKLSVCVHNCAEDSDITENGMIVSVN